MLNLSRSQHNLKNSIDTDYLDHSRINSESYNNAGHMNYPSRLNSESKIINSPNRLSHHSRLDAQSYISSNYSLNNLSVSKGKRSVEHKSNILLEKIKVVSFF